MAGPYWVSVAVLVLMTVRNGETVIDPNQLAPIVQDILNRYTPSYGANNNRKFPMFSVAVSVPYNEQTNTFDMNGVPDYGEVVRETILNCDVYQGNRVMAATVLKWPNVLDQCPNAYVQWPDVLRKCHREQMKWAEVERLCGADTIKYGRADHAEFRTLQDFQPLLATQSKDDLMVFYVRDSPCDQRCTNKLDDQNILTMIQDITNWKNYVVVFSDVFRPRDSGHLLMNNLGESLKWLGKAIADRGSNGLQNIFRCHGQQEMKCFSCNNNGDVAFECILDSLPT
ncbi:uncharacterized protein LOC113024842 isoform X2 [Astatotilapia calliptera]|nr:uncharacterized protein LOC113024842 isoform X2 [Astatotilapia calliptera]